MKARKLLSVFLILLLLSVLSTPALAAVDLDDPQYVVDDAGVLSSELEEKILSANEKLWDNCSGAEFVVVTVNYPPAGLDQEEFAKKIFDTWHIGSAARDNGLLLVLYTEADDFWLQPGEGVFSSPYVDELADLVGDDSAFYKAILADQDEKAVSVLLEGVTGWYMKHYKSTSGGSANGGTTYADPSGDISDGQAILVLLLLILIFIILTSPVRCRRVWGHWGIWPFYYFSPWWKGRTRPIRPSTYRAPVSYHHTASPSRPSSGHSSRSSSGSSYRSGGGRSSSGGFGGGRSSGGFSGRPGGGRSGSGGFGHR